MSSSKFRHVKNGTNINSVLKGCKQSKDTISQSLSKIYAHIAFKHQYSLSVVTLVIELYKYGGVSLRSYRHSLLCHEDISVLYVGASQEWKEKGEHIASQLEEIATHHEIEYVVSDEGTNLRKAYKTLNYIHVENCTHILSKYTKRIYEKDSVFETFRKLIGKLRRDWTLSKAKSQYMPPTMRGKMRFANIFPGVNWAKKMLTNWDNLDVEVQSRLPFLKENSDFIQSLIEVEVIFKRICTKLKNQGFQAAQKQVLLDSFTAMKAGEKASVFIENCKGYLENLTMKSKVLKQKFLLCSSALIESKTLVNMFFLAAKEGISCCTLHLKSDKP